MQFLQGFLRPDHFQPTRCVCEELFNLAAFCVGTPPPQGGCCCGDLK